MEQMSRKRQVACRASHDWAGEASVTSTLLDAFREVLGPDGLLDQPPLYETVDPDALNAVFAPTRTTSGRNGVVRFDFAGYAVEVRATGEIVVYDD